MFDRRSFKKSKKKPVTFVTGLRMMVEGGGFEPPKAEPSDLQSDPFGHSGTPPGMTRIMSGSETLSIVFPLLIKNLRLLCAFI